jgi:hypothetical protein
MKQDQRRRNGWIGALLLVLVGITGLHAQAQPAGLPTPDVSALRPWYDMVSWTYDAGPGQLSMVVKPTGAPPQLHRGFVMRYFDAAGHDVVAVNFTQLIPLGYNTPAGQEERISGGAPTAEQARRVSTVAVYRILDDGSMAGPPPPTGAARRTPAPPPAGSSAAKAPPANSPAAAGCSFAAPPAVTAHTPFSQLLLKRLLYDRYAFETNTGGLSSPSRLGLSYLTLQNRASYPNTVTVVPGRGAQRKQSGAPVNATIYPFHASYIVCRQFANTTTQTRYDSNFVCFQASNGNWDCAADGVPKITHLP